MTDQSMPDQPTASTESEATHKQAVSAVPRMSERFDAFLSHNSQDKPDVEKIREKLQAAGIKVWIDRNELSGGDSLPTTLKRALENSAACVVFIGAHGVGPWQEKEIAAADKLKRPKRRMIPVFLPGSARELPASLKEKELLWIEFRDFDDQLALDKLTEDIRTKVKDQSWWDRARQILIAAGVFILLLVLGWATKEFCTFQAEFGDRAYPNQRVEVVVTRKLNPFGYRLGTSIFKDELIDSENGGINRHLQLNTHLSPSWNPLICYLREERLGLAEIEFLERAVTKPQQFFKNPEALEWGRVSAAVADALVTQLNDEEDHIIRFNAAANLGNIACRDAAVIDALVPRLHDVHPWVCSHAAAALVQLGRRDATVIHALFELLKNSDSSVRALAAESMGKLANCDAEVVDALVARLKDEDGDVRYRTAGALVRLGKSNPAVCDVLVNLLQNSSSEVRFWASSSLLRLGKGDANVTEVLVKLLNDPGESPFGPVSSRAAQALGQLRKSETKVIQALVVALKDTDEDVRCRAAESLGELGGENAAVTDALVSLLKAPGNDHFGKVRSSAAASLGQLGKSNEAVVASLVALLKWPDYRVRETARVALLKLGKSDATVVDALVALLEEADSYVRVSAAESLVQLGKSDHGIKTALSSLLKKEENYNARTRAAAALGRLGEIDSLVALLEDENRDARFHAAEYLGKSGNSDVIVINSLVKRLKDQDQNVRASAAKALGQLRKSDPVVIAALVISLKDEATDVRVNATSSLGQLGQECGNWRDGQMIVDLADLDSGIRERAGIVLAYRRQKVDSELTPIEIEYLKDIRGQVEKLRKDPRPWVRQASLHALYHIEKRKAELETAAQSSKESKK